VHCGALQTGGLEQCVELLDRALTAGTHDEHVHVEDGREWVFLTDDHLDDGDSASRSQRLSAVPQDRDGLVVVPGVQDELQQEQVAGRNGFEEVTAEDPGALRQTVSRDYGSGRS